MADRRKLRPTLWPVSRNAIIACAGLCGAALTPQFAFSQTVDAVPSRAPLQFINPDTETILAISSGAYRLADDITAGPLNGSLCIDAQQTFSALDFPIIVDKSNNVATGWFINENKTFSLDLRTGKAEISGVKKDVGPGNIGAVSTGPCLTIESLSALLGISIEYVSNGSALTVTSAQQLPLIGRLERQNRSSFGPRDANRSEDAPRLRSLPYRAFVAPNTNVNLFLNRRNLDSGNGKLNTGWSILSVGELAYMTAEAQLGTTGGRFNGDISRVKLYRTEAEGGVFGLPKLTEFAVGDIIGYGTSLGANSNVGFGVSASTFPLNRPTSFNTTSFEGALPAGWDVELYRNGELLEFRNDGTTGGYSFRDVPVLFGNNNFEIVQYGPQGQRRVISKRINASNFMGPKGSAYYRGAVYRPGVMFSRKSNTEGIRVDLVAALGIAANLNLGGSFNSYMLRGNRLSVATVSALTSVSGIALNAELSGTSDGHIASQIEFQGTGRGASLRGRAIWAQEGYRTERLSDDVMVRFEAGADRGFTLPGRASGTLSAQVGFDKFYSGESLFVAKQRMSLVHGNSWLAQSLSWSHSATGARRDVIEGDVGYAYRRGQLALRASAEFSVYPEAKLNRLSASVERQIGVDDNDWRWRAETNWDAREDIFIHSVSIGREFRTFSVDLIADTDGRKSHSIGISLGFALGRRNNGWGMSSRPLASSGTVRARVFEDVDDNGSFSAGDIPVAKIGVIGNGSRDTSTTDANGYAYVDSVAPNIPSVISVMSEDFEDPNLFANPVFTKAREGTVSEISIPLRMMGNIEGNVEMIAGFDPNASPLGGVSLALLNGESKEVARTTSAYDGYYSFETVPVGTYSVVIAPDTAIASRLRPVVPLQVATTRQTPGAQASALTLIEINPTSTRMALRGLI